MITLDALPNEILSLITNFLEHPRDVSNLALSCRRVNEFIQLDGWKAYLRGRFAVTDRDSDARNTVHGITTLYRNWERKAFVARFLHPGSSTITSLNDWEQTTWLDQSTQTMGYQPSIDSYEEICGGWADRREVLAWSAGARVLMRIKGTDRTANCPQREDLEMGSEVYGNPPSWYSYGMPNAIEGVDDIMSVGLLRPHQKDGSLECVAMATANGDLELVCFDVANRRTRRQRYAQPGWRQSFLSISPATQPLMATAADNMSLQLYPVDPHRVDDSVQTSLSEAEVQAPLSISFAPRLWACNFVSEDKVAVGIGPSHQIVQVFGITPTGFSPNPLRKFNASPDPDDALYAYSLLPLPADSHAGDDSGNIIFSGASDGFVRLHDLRSHRDSEAIFVDVTNNNPIYSLALQGQERIIAGANTHSMLKIYDIRFPGTHAYNSISLPSKPPVCKADPYDRARAFDDLISPRKLADAQPITGGWNLYLRPRNIRKAFRGHRYQETSSVYSLSIPSSTSPSLYAGLTGSIMGLDFVSVLDKHPDPLIAGDRLQYLDTGDVDVVQSYNPDDGVVDLSMYHQGSEKELDMSLFVQHSANNEIGEKITPRDAGKLAGMDGRWRDPAQDRWVRGQEPLVQTRSDRGHRRSPRTRRR